MNCDLLSQKILQDFPFNLSCPQHNDKRDNEILTITISMFVSNCHCIVICMCRTCHHSIHCFLRFFQPCYWLHASQLLTLNPTLWEEIFNFACAVDARGEKDCLIMHFWSNFIFVWFILSKARLLSSFLSLLTINIPLCLYRLSFILILLIASF